VFGVRGVYVVLRLFQQGAVMLQKVADGVGLH
jgi:hypothetical protein